MNKSTLVKKLQRLEGHAKRIPDKLQISRAGEVLYQASQDAWSDNEVVVEADGNGGAILLIVEGNYPIDYMIHSDHHFSSESAACDAADALVE
jgi:hypothetical protein